MPQSRNRPGHVYQKKSDVPSSQRAKGRVLWAILLGVFAVLIALFAVGSNFPILLVAAVAGAVLGYGVGKNMERDAKK